MGKAKGPSLDALLALEAKAEQTRNAQLATLKADEQVLAKVRQQVWEAKAFSLGTLALNAGLYGYPEAWLVEGFSTLAEDLATRSLPGATEAVTPAAAAD